MDDLNLIKYTMILDEDVKDMFVVDKVKMNSPIKYYTVLLKDYLTTKSHANQICKDLNELISKYLDGKLK